MASRITTFRTLFALVGMIYGVYAARLPALKIQTGMDDADVGFMLLAFGVGSLLGFSMIGRTLRIWSSAQFLRFLQIILPLMLIVMGFSANVVMAIAVAVVLGYFIGSYDVLMNVQGILLEKTTKRRHLTSLHAFYSFGGFAGAGFGSLCAWFDFTPWMTFIAFSAVAYVWVLPNSMRLLPDEEPKADGNSKSADKMSLPIFTFICGLFALCAYITEGCAGEWGSIFLVSEKGADQATAALSFSVFAISMACCRLFGDKLRNMYGDLFVFSSGAVIALVAMSIVLFASHPWVCLAGYALLGVGLFSIVPIAMSRASDGGVSPARSSTVVAFFGYTGLLVVPPVLGNIAKMWSLSTAFLIPLICCVILVVGSIVFRKKRSED